MDKRKLSEALGSHPYGAYTVENVCLVNWGRDLIFDCVYDPAGPSKPVPFRLIFKDCRELRWKAYAHLDVEPNGAHPGRQPATPLVDIRIGRGQHRSPTHILTDHFGVSLSCGQALLQAGDQTPVALSQVEK